MEVTSPVGEGLKSCIHVAGIAYVFHSCQAYKRQHKQELCHFLSSQRVAQCSGRTVWWLTSNQTEGDATTKGGLSHLVRIKSKQDFNYGIQNKEIREKIFLLRFVLFKTSEASGGLLSRGRNAYLWVLAHPLPTLNLPLLPRLWVLLSEDDLLAEELLPREMIKRCYKYEGE